MVELQLPKLLTWVRFPSPAPILLAAALIVAVPAGADAIDDLVRAEMQRQKIPGLALAIIKDGQPFKIAGYGESNVEHHVAVVPQTVFQSGSVGKQFAAAAIQLLAAEGKLSFDDPLSRWITHVPPSLDRITIRHLLTHTSGIREYTDGENGPAFDFRADYDEQRLVDLALRQPRDFEPGSRWSYSNTGYLLLGAVIRQACGMYYGDFLAQRIFGPLGMTTARIISEADIVPNRAAGYELIDGGLKNQEWVSPSLNTTADGSLYLSVLDLVRWDAALRDVKLLSRQQLDQAWTPVTLSGGGTYPYGFGWFIGEQRGWRNIEHGGAWQGFRTQIARYVDRDLTVIALANLAEADPHWIAQRVAGLVDAALALPDPARAMPDPNPQRTQAVLDALTAWSEGGTSSAMTAGYAADLKAIPGSTYRRGLVRKGLEARTSFHFLDEVEVAGRDIERHGAKVAKILYLGLSGPEGSDLVTAYLDSAGKVAALSFNGS